MSKIINKNVIYDTDELYEALKTAIAALNRIAYPKERTYDDAQFIAMEALEEMKIVGKNYD